MINDLPASNETLDLLAADERLRRECAKKAFGEAYTWYLIGELSHDIFDARARVLSMDMTLEDTEQVIEEVEEAVHTDPMLRARHFAAFGRVGEELELKYQIEELEDSM